MFQAAMIGACPAFFQRLQEQALGYASVNASEAALTAVSWMGFAQALTMAGSLLFLGITLPHARRKTPWAGLALVVCGSVFAFSSLAVGASVDEEWAARARVEPGPCQTFFQDRKALGQDSATHSFLIGACMAHTEARGKAS